MSSMHPAAYTCDALDAGRAAENRELRKHQHVDLPRLAAQKSLHVKKQIGKPSIWSVSVHANSRHASQMTARVLDLAATASL
jgi:hypothetical protein